MKSIHKDPNRVLFPKSGNGLASSLGSHSTSGGAAASILSNKRLTLPFLVLLAALAVGVLFLLPGGLLQAQESSSIMFPENSEDAVATFTAMDPEGVTSLTWSVLADDATFTDIDGVDTADAADADHFMIDKDGMLKFAIGTDNDPPDFEAPRGAEFNAATNTNTYKVVVAASDGSVTGYHKVTVMVTDAEEMGKVTWTVDADGGTPHTETTPKLTQFQVGASLMASVRDGDIGGTNKVVEAARTDVAADPTWRWYRSSSKTSMGTMIDGETSATYDVTTADVGMHLRVVAYYVVTGNVDQETGSFTSDYPVLAVRAGNNALKFSRPLSPGRCPRATRA